MGGAQGRLQLRRRLVSPKRHAVHRLSPATGGLLAPAVIGECCDWLQHCLTNIPTWAAKIFYFISDENKTL